MAIAGKEVMQECRLVAQPMGTVLCSANGSTEEVNRSPAARAAMEGPAKIKGVKLRQRSIAFVFGIVFDAAIE